MSFFGKKKEESEHKDTINIKNATTQKNNNQPNLNSEPKIENTNFVNPFSNQLATPQTTNSLNQNNNNPNINNNISLNQTNNNKNNSTLNPNPNNFNTNPTINTQSNNQTTPELKETPISNIEKNISKPEITREEIQEMVDETVEKIIEDKWEKLLTSVEKVVSWKETQETEVGEIKEVISEIKENFEKLEKKLSTKISTYDSGLLDVNAEIKALEKVFQKITPTLVNNVNNLEKIAISIKESTKANVEFSKSPELK